MTLPRSAADVLAGHVLFEIEAIDRMYLNLYQPRLQHGAGIAAFFVGHRGHRFASSALMGPMTRAFVADIDHFAAARDLDLVRFTKGQRKDEVTGEYLRRAELDDRGLVSGQVLYVGVAQERQKVFRTSKRRNPVTGATYPWLVPGSGMVNQYYFYCVDEDFGPYADRPVMPHRVPLCGSQRLRVSSAAFPRGGVSGSQGVEEGQEAVGRRVSSFRGASGCQPCERLFLELHVGVQVDACGGRRLVAEPQGDDGDVDACVQQ